MARFKGAILNCIVCGAEFKVPPSRASTAKTCSNECGYKVRAESIKRSVTLQCDHCGKEFETPRCHAGRRKYCSYECKHASPEYRQTMSESTTGEANGNWVGGRILRKDGYIYRIATDHPFAANGYVLEHRLVVEEWLVKEDPRSKFLIRVFGKPHLSPAYEVHHKDGNRQNNDLSNLECLTPSEHQRLHARLRWKQTRPRVEKIGDSPDT